MADAALPPLRRLVPSAIAFIAAILFALALGSFADSGRDLALAALFGTAFGIVLQRSRFCFFCVSRDFYERRDVRGLLGIVVALAVGILGYHLVFGAFLPVPAPGRLPPQAHIGPISWVLGAGAFSFGLGMALSGSCISAHLYRLGEGSVLSPFALLGTLFGFFLGFLSWNTLYLAAIQEAPIVWLPHHLGYGGSVALQLFALAAVAIWLWRQHRKPESAPHSDPWQRRWPTYAGGILVGFIGVLAYFRLGPLGVTAELGSLARTTADSAHLLPTRLEGLDTFSGCATRIKETLWSPNGAFIVALIIGSLAAALSAGDFKLRRPRLFEVVRALLGGVLMGWGSMVALGCTVGTLLSGIMAGAASGWIFAVFMFGGLWLGWRARVRFGWNS
ncbi:MAG: YeeE/YedE family protein [Oxalicibacterium faecigallinarum]|uniref:YeeE/YedE family protein n=1 Tax=Oxalicibacterium faecigallinarum TaxID=573741 RepID=UPI002807525C|nr:YeeE/YedE family protein [Oxalicibacterium faecigallinarum]MDQ7970447.1 YeeE/YedE family protein [Oxalicibacterium faecigallinarum]